MRTKDLKLSLPNGLHMRVAARLVLQSKKIKSKVIICKDGNTAELNSILQLMILGAERGSEIKIIVEGEDESSAITEVCDILTDGAGI